MVTGNWSCALDTLKKLNNCIAPLGFLTWEIWVTLPGKIQQQQSYATQPMVNAGCFSFSIIHQTMTWTTGPITCAQIVMHISLLVGALSPN